MEAGTKPAGRERDAEATREALINAATELFAERGFDGAKIDAIARRAGVNKAMVSYHFAGKQGLYAVIFERDLAWVHDQFGAIDAALAPADDKLRRFIATVGELQVRRPSWAAMMLREVMSGGRHVEPRFLETFARVFALLQKIVAQGVREGTFRPVDPLFTHHTVMGSIVFFFAARPFRERMIAEGRVNVPTPDPAQFIAHVQELLTLGLTPIKES
jgi:TetR/AcrR family transcriptional regulator